MAAPGDVPADGGRAEVSVVTPAVESSREPEPEPEQRARRTWPGAPWLVLSCYLLGALALTARVWADPAGRSQAGDLPDVNQVTWFMRYSATAISHFRLPALVTTAMNPPHGVELLWNTSLLLPGVLMTPVTLLAGPQVSLNVLLTLGFAGSAAAMFIVLRRWDVSVTAAALGGALYGFSPALVASGIGHYHLLLAMLPPLIIDRLLRIVIGRDSAVRNGLWLGLLVAAQLFIGEEALVDTVIAGGLMVVILAVCRPRAVLGQVRTSAIGLATAAGVALLLCARALWVQFKNAGANATGATTVIHFDHKLQHLYTIPYAFVTPSNAMFFHTSASAAAANAYPEPLPEYLAYLGWPLIIVLVACTIYFWRHLQVRVVALTLVVLELISLGSNSLVLLGIHYPAYLLPWYWLQDLPVLKTALPDRLSILADGAAGAVLAFSLDLVRRRARDRADEPAAEPHGNRWRNAGLVATAVAVLALLPLVPRPYQSSAVTKLPDGWQATFTSLHLAPGARVLIAPVPNGSTSEPMRWQADTGEPASMIGGDFITPNEPLSKSRSGRAGQTVTTKYIDALWTRSRSAIAAAAVPTRAQINANLATWQPAAVVADTSPNSLLGHFLIKVFGQPTSHIGQVIAWRL